MSTPLLDRLRERPGAFDFYQAVRLLERELGGRTPGEGADPADEPVRFRAADGFAFPASDLVSVQPRGAGQREMTVTFLALGGAEGPLPVPLAHRAVERAAENDTATRDFLDLFHHRLVSLAYRIGRRTRPVLQEKPPQDTENAASLRALIGIGTPGLRHRIPGMDDRALLARAGLLANEVRSQAGLEGLLADHFGVPVSIEPLAGRWLPIPAGQRTRIGRAGASRTLGADAVLGARWHDPQAAIGIRVGPLPIALFRSLLPTGGRAVAELRELVRFYAGSDTDFVLTLVLRADETPPARLTAARTPAAPRLGWSAWLLTRPPAADPVVRVDPAEACGCGAERAPPTPDHPGSHHDDAASRRPAGAPRLTRPHPLET